MAKQGASTIEVDFTDLANDPYDLYKEPVYLMDNNEKKIIQLRWLGLFSDLIAKRYAKIDSDKCLNFITARDRKRHQLLEGILRHEKNPELIFLALPAYHFSADLLGVRAKTLVELGLAVGEAPVEPIVTVIPRPAVEYKVAPALEERVEGIAIPFGVSDVSRKEKPKAPKAKRADFTTKAFWVATAASVFLLAASKLGGMAMDYLENKQEHRIKREYQELVHKKEFEKLIKGFRNNKNVFYTKDLMALNLDVKPGKYKLSQILQTNSYFGEEYAVLDSINIEAKERTKPLMDPLENSTWGQRYTNWCKRTIWGMEIAGSHRAIDMNSKTRSLNIHSSAVGVVERVYNINNGRAGKYVVINHGNGLKTFYAHMSTILVKEGDSIGDGYIIGLMGKTGRATNIHLHYELIKDGKEVNPARYLDRGVCYDSKTILALMEIDRIYNPNRAFEGLMTAKLPKTKDAGAKSFFLQ